jgi:hypothetical protein
MTTEEQQNLKTLRSDLAELMKGGNSPSIHAKLTIMYANQEDYLSGKRKSAVVELQASEVHGRNYDVFLRGSIEYDLETNDPILINEHWIEALGPHDAEERSGDTGDWWNEYTIHDEDVISNWLLPALSKP